jgi:hypothetical protein
MVARLPTTLRHQPGGAVALVGIAKSADLASGDAEKLGSFHPLETPLEHAATTSRRSTSFALIVTNSWANIPASVPSDAPHGGHFYLAQSGHY